jgi:hypothetical protein
MGRRRGSYAGGPFIPVCGLVGHEAKVGGPVCLVPWPTGVSLNAQAGYHHED